MALADVRQILGATPYAESEHTIDMRVYLDQTATTPRYTSIKGTVLAWAAEYQTRIYCKWANPGDLTMALAGNLRKIQTVPGIVPSSVSTTFEQDGNQRVAVTDFTVQEML